MSRNKRPSNYKRHFRWQATLGVAFATLMLLVAYSMLPAKLQKIAKAGNANLAPAQTLATGEVLGDFDARTGTVTPDSSQLNMVSGLGAAATWNKFGTPASMIKHGGYLATGLSGPDAATAARDWINANKALFRLSSTDSLKVIGDAALAQSNAYAVNFRQEFGNLLAAEDGLLTVGIVGSAANGWKIAYVSSSITGFETVTGSKQLSAQDAWLRAAADVGRPVSSAAINNSKADREWTLLGVQGFAHAQRVRLAALPTPNDGVRPVYETLVMDNQSGHMTAYTHYVDAADGRIWLRKNIVEQSHPTAAPFAGTVPLADGACAPDNGPWTVTASESIGSVAVSVEATIPANDVVIHLLRNGAIVASQDTGTSPEALVYDPLDNGAGTYTVRVCDFGDAAAWLPPSTYNGQIVFNPQNAQAGLPYPPKWKVFPANPLIGNEMFPFNNPNTDIRKVWCWESTVGFPAVAVPGCEYEVQNLASRVPWDYNPRTNTPTFTTSGNNANSAEAWTSPLTPGPPGQRPFSLTREYIYPWNNDWHKNAPLPAPPGCSESNLVPQGNDIDAAVTNLFAMHNRMHDWSYFLGFTERRWNAQLSNFGTGNTAEGDPVTGNAQAGAVNGGFPSYLGRDNANMVTTPDGVPPITNMYLWQPLAGAFYAPCVDGDYDMAVIGHEYGHLIENRMIGKGNTRGGHHAGAMGESFGDFDAAEYLNEYGFVPVSGENKFAVGAYAVGNKDRAIRNYGMNFPRTGAIPTPGVSLVKSGEPLVNPLNFSNIGYDITGSQVHADGEIWSAVNHDIRAALAAKYNATYPESDAALQKKCADGLDTPDHCPGNRRWIQLVYDAMLLMPVAPSMIEAREAYLAADLMRFGGANQAELWQAFAQRGFGKEATSTNGLSNDVDGDPKPDFQRLVPNTNATVTFATTKVEGAFPKARIFVGHYEARVSPIADTDPATGPADNGAQTVGSSNLDNKAGFAPGTYEFVAVAPAYGHIRFTQTFTAGQIVTVGITFPTNYAAGTRGAVATGDGANHAHLIDGKEGTNWDEPIGGLPVNVQNPQVTVDLAGTTPRNINRVQVSALLEIGQNRFTALRQFRIDTSTNGVLFTPWITSIPDAFPGFNPRPVAPEMLLRSFTGPTRSATHVRIVVLHNQCTGNADFQGEQDNDPLNDTDCRFGNPGSGPVPPPFSEEVPDVLLERASEVHIAELQVFDSLGSVTGGTGGVLASVTAPAAATTTKETVAATTRTRKTTAMAATTPGALMRPATRAEEERSSSLVESPSKTTAMDGEAIDNVMVADANTFSLTALDAKRSAAYREELLSTRRADWYFATRVRARSRPSGVHGNYTTRV